MESVIREMQRTLLADLPAHRGLYTGQMGQSGCLAAICDLQCAVIKRIRALGIGIGPAFPAFDRES